MARRRPDLVAGFVLAGGGSSQMGRDKALLPLKRSTLIESVAREIFLAAGNVTLIGSLELHGNIRFPGIPDRIAGSSPLGGRYAALSVTGADWNVPVARLSPVVASFIQSKLLKMQDFVATIHAGNSARLNINTPELPTSEQGAR
jgi:molybdopterin-guanine dinucleotide biosynthesis protein A